MENLNKMEIFKSNQKFLVTLGITRHQAMQTQPFNAKISLQLFIFCLPVISFSGYFIFEANSFKEYTESIYFISAVAGVGLKFLMFALNSEQFFNFVDSWGKCTEESEYGTTCNCK